MKTRSITVIVHNVGHHDVYPVIRELRAADRSGLANVSNFGQYSFGTAIETALDGSHALAPGEQPGLYRLEPPLPLDWNPRNHGGRLVDRNQHALGLEQITVEALYLPLLEATLRATASAHPDDALHLLLVTNGPLEAVRERGQTTAALGSTIRHALAGPWPELTVHHLHNPTADPFSFADSATLHREVDAKIAALRRRVVEECGEDWPRAFRVLLSTNTGTVAMISTLLEGLRVHRPGLVHIPTAHRWPATRGTLTLPKATLLDHDTMTQRPPRPTADVAEEAQLLAIHTMREWRAEFEARRPRRPTEGENDEEYAFWFRKGRKEVLAVLVARDPREGGLVAHRAVNLEVSLPTGTLCAERNAIGTALATHPDLRRADLKAVAVLSLDAKNGPRLGPCGACAEWLRKVAEINPDFRVITFADAACESVYIDPVG